MQRTLSSRVERLEASAPKQVEREEPISAPDVQEALDRLRRIINLSGEPDDRAAALTLEERLAVARRDAAPKPDVWADLWDPQLGRLRNQLVKPDRRPARAARELELLILERDGRINSDTAKAYRANIDAHFEAEPFGSVGLLELPCPVVIENEPAVADAALQKCPLRETLPLETQLELAKRDAEGDQRRWDAAEAKGTPYQFRAISEEYSKWTIVDLERKLAERDRRPPAA